MIRIQRNSDGTPKTNHTTHTADLECDCCGASGDGIDMNANATYDKNLLGVNTGISFNCATLGGACSGSTCWPLSGGTADAQEIALVKTA